MDMSLEKENVKVEWVDLGESSFGGEYDPDNPRDIAVLRFDVFTREDEKAEWEDPGNASYSTNMPVDTPEPILMQALKRILGEVFDVISSGISIKKTCSDLSFIEPSWTEKKQEVIA